MFEPCNTRTGGSVKIPSPTYSSSSISSMANIAVVVVVVEGGEGHIE